MTRGVFVSLDGLDGSGKSTQCRLLADRLRAGGRHVTQCADPGGTAVGQVIRNLLLEHRGEMALPCEALLFMASRAQLTTEVIRPALQAGHVVVSDRFLLANLAYQGYAADLDVAVLRAIGSFATGGLLPDLTLVLDLPVAVARARRKGPVDRVESRDADYHARVREGFLAEARLWPDRIRIVDATQPAEAVHERICQEVARVLAARSGT
jgi:dTMP kinase